ncbi:uncharacterized protein LOC111712896 [Eurytemora carolleeae]|uniref:uncharacterized protein LOC111712896 n=1 Tax=Eurytemora carolleeae TaxID=1294199 RepID=UPI000C78DA7A|nr:uncharacterized protein LOC111712896 [Eurytemora carolleeae]|eukprot:XP_023343416.1 uncharacterized protein LOC111712896 [Eurytemora affinis]
MSGAIEQAAKNFLVDPAYQKVFKHTFDVLEDYISGFLIAAGAISLSVRFLTSLGTGDAICLLIGIDHPNGSYEAKLENAMWPYGSSSVVPYTNYANFHQDCINACLTRFLQYSPFILLIEALLVIMTEKFFLKIPRVAGKVERFYTNIVEESLFGKDPDVAEDVVDDKANTEAISRRRRRNEVCMSLKRSSVIHQMYVFKNIMELILLIVFIPINVFFAIEAEKSLKPGTCAIGIAEINTPFYKLENGTVFFQCEGKKVSFFIMMVYIQIVFQICCIICCLGSLIWALFFRSISRLLRNIEKIGDIYYQDLEKSPGEDFLFLFDLLAHSSGIESTLRVLTHSDDTFRKICLPRLKIDSEHIKVEEDKLKIVWAPAGIEKWLIDHGHREIRVDSYDVTIFPAESTKNTVSKKAKLKGKHSNSHDDDKYSAWFFDLAGGKTEYIVTIATVIGRSRMKGERIVTNLLPYGPEKPRAGMLKTSGTHEIEISWEPPKGDFTKYILSVDPNIVNGNQPKGTQGLPAPPLFGFGVDHGLFNVAGSFGDLTKATTGYTEREISNKLTSFTISGLSPGETFGIGLKTKTGDRITRQPIYETVLTKPEKVTSVAVSDVLTDNALLKWVAPDGHSRLKAYNLLLTSKDNKSRRELAVKHNSGTPVNSFLFENLPSATEFTVAVTTVCVFEKLKSISEEEKISFVTRPLPPRNLELESRLSSSLQVKWEAPPGTTANNKFKLSIQAPAIGYSNSYEIGGDRHMFNFSKFPEIIGTGEAYTVKVSFVVQPTGSDIEVESEGLIGTFVSKPLPPTNLKLGPGWNQISWTKSPTPNVSMYKIRYKSIEEGSKSEEYLIGVEDDNDPCTCVLEDLVMNIQYKVNIYAVVEVIEFEMVESKELHEKLVQTDSGLVVYTDEMERADSSLAKPFNEILS